MPFLCRNLQVDVCLQNSAFFQHIPLLSDEFGADLLVIYVFGLSPLCCPSEEPLHLKGHGKATTGKEVLHVVHPQRMLERRSLHAHDAVAALALEGVFDIKFITNLSIID